MPTRSKVEPSAPFSSDFYFLDLLYIGSPSTNRTRLQYAHPHHVCFPCYDTPIELVMCSSMSLKEEHWRIIRTKIALVNVCVFDGYQLRDPSANPTTISSFIDSRRRVLIPCLIDSHYLPRAVSDFEKPSSYGVTTALNMACFSCKSFQWRMG